MNGLSCALIGAWEQTLQDYREDQQRGEHEGEANGAGEEDGGVAARGEHGAAQVFLHQGPDDVAEQQRRGKPNEAMLDEALTVGTDVALLVTFEPSIPSLKKELEELASSRGIRLQLKTRTVPAAIGCQARPRR